MTKGSGSRSTGRWPEAEGDPDSNPDGGRLLLRGAALAAAVAITVVVYLLRDTITLHAGLGYAGIFLFMIVSNATLILPAPAWAVVFAVGGALNPILLALVAGSGAALGEMTGYLAGYSGRATLDNQAWYGRVQKGTARYGGWVIFLLGAVPNPIFDAGGIAAGVLRMPVWKFLLAAAAGKALRFLVIALVGSWFA